MKKFAAAPLVILGLGLILAIDITETCVSVKIAESMEKVIDRSKRFNRTMDWAYWTMFG